MDFMQKYALTTIMFDDVVWYAISTPYHKYLVILCLNVIFHMNYGVDHYLLEYGDMCPFWRKKLTKHVFLPS